MGACAPAGEYWDGSESDSASPNGFARVAKRTQLVVSRREVGLEQGVEKPGGMLESRGLLQPDSVEGTAVLPRRRPGAQPRLPALAVVCTAPGAVLLSPLRWLLGGSKRSAACETFPSGACDCHSVGWGSTPSLPALGVLGPARPRRTLGRAPSRIQLRVAMGGLGDGKHWCGQLRPWDPERLAEVAGGGRI